VLPEVRNTLSDRGFEVLSSSRGEFLLYVRAESDKLGKLILGNGIQIDRKERRRSLAPLAGCS
jgi:hypothetical protein